MNGFTVGSQLMKVNAMSDGGVSLGFHTQEVPADEKVKMMGFFHKSGWLLFSEDVIPDHEIPATNSSFEGKTPSQRLRAVLFVFWKQLGEKGKFEDFYSEKMESFIGLVKGKLDQP